MGFVTVSISTRAHNRRRNQRVAEPALQFIIGGETYLARNWSLGGFAAIQRGAADLSAGEPVRVTALLLPDGRRERLDIEARIVRSPPRAAELAVEFLVLSDKAFRLLERLLVHRKP